MNQDEAEQLQDTHQELVDRIQRIEEDMDDILIPFVLTSYEGSWLVIRNTSSPESEAYDDTPCLESLYIALRRETESLENMLMGAVQNPPDPEEFEVGDYIG